MSETVAIFDDSGEASGVCVADGYGLRISIDRRHLVVADGSGQHRRQRRYAKAGHGLRRLVILGRTGTVSLEALRWLDRTGIGLIHLDPDGTLLTTNARPRLDDARLRRAQALAATNQTGTEITRALLAAKLAGQAHNAEHRLDDSETAEQIHRQRIALDATDDLDGLREIEAAAAGIYFAAWNGQVQPSWAATDRPHIAEHWKTFNGRRSPLAAGSAIRAADPLNAILNFLYALAEAECRHACLVLGLDPGIGILHADAKGSDSLALDLIEVVRPDIDAYVLDLAQHHTFRRADFAEADDGHVRILAPLTHQLAHTLDHWETAVAPWAELVAHALAEASPRSIRKATPLTGAVRRRTALESSSSRRKHPVGPLPAPLPSGGRSPLGPACIDCGTVLASRQRTYCPDCWPTHRADAARRGSQAAAGELVDAERRKQRGHAVAAGKARAHDQAARAHGFEPDDWPDLSAKVSDLTLRQIMDATGLAISQASRIKTGARVPHPRHWPALDAATRSAPQV